MLSFSSTPVFSDCWDEWGYWNYDECGTGDKDPWGEECFEAYDECVTDAFWGNYEALGDCHEGGEFEECTDLLDIELEIELDDCEYIENDCLGFW